MDNSPATYTRWPDRLALEVALFLMDSGSDLDEIAKKYNLSLTDFQSFQNDPLFIQQVDLYKEKLEAGGKSFKLMAQAQAMELLDTAWQLIHSPDTSAAVKADLIKNTVKWAGYEPKPDTVASDTGSAGGVNITINLGDKGETPLIIDQAPVLKHEKIDA